MSLLITDLDVNEPFVNEGTRDLELVIVEDLFFRLPVAAA
jgi:hypothetical protein